MEFLKQASQCLLQHAWATEIEEVRIFKSSLALIPDSIEADSKSVLHPQQPHAPLAWGGVPGQWQTAPRAELCAFLAALCL